MTPIVICGICREKFTNRSAYNDHRRNTGAGVHCVKPEHDYELEWHKENSAWESYGILRLVKTNEILNFYSGGM